MIKVSVHDAPKHAGDFALDIDLSLPETGVTAIFGPSGSGKTSLLRCIAGLDKVSQAEVCIGDLEWQSHNHFTPVHKRQLGYVFQEASLFPHLTAKENLEFAMQRAHGPVPGGQWQHIIRLLGIEECLGRKPETLSGGERQRVAIARAVLSQPKLLLMDEPLSSLDYRRKQEILPYLETLHQTLNIPILYVTHDLDEVTRLADNLVVLEAGNVAAQGSVQDVAQQTALFAMQTEQCSSLIDGQLTHFDEKWHLTRFEFPGGELWLSGVNKTLPVAARLRIMAKDISLSTQPQENTSIVNHLRSHILTIKDTPEPAMQLVTFECGGHTLVARITKRSIDTLGLAPGLPVWAHIKAAAVVR